MFFDLIARVVPGVVAVVLFSLIAPGMSWGTLLNLASGGKLDKENVVAVSFLVPLAVGYIVGHLIAPLGKLLARVTTGGEPWERYDYLRVHLPDIGALAAKIRAEYTMHFSLAAAFLLGTVGLVLRSIAGCGLPWYWAALCLAFFAASMYRGDESRRIFGLSVENLYKAAQQERPRAASTPSTPAPRPSTEAGR